MINQFTISHRPLYVCALLLLLNTACSVLKPAPPPAFYVLDNAQADHAIIKKTSDLRTSNAPTLIVNPPHAGSGFDSVHIIYVRKSHQLEYFAHHAWIDTPARMLAPLMVKALERSGAYRVVTLTPSTVIGDLRLDSEIIRLQQDFSSTPSQVRFTLRAYLVDNNTREVVAWREFDEVHVAQSDDPYGGIVAANQAVARVLEQLAIFCAEATPSATPAIATPRMLDRPSKQ